MKLKPALTFIFLFLLYSGLGIVYPAAIFASEPNPTYNLASIGALIIVEYSVIRLLVTIIKKNIQPLAITFWLFTLFWLGLAPFAQTLSNKFFWYGYYSEDTQTLGIVIIMVGLACYEIGRSIAQKSSRSIEIKMYIPTNRIAIITLISFATAAISINVLGGLDKVITTRALLTEQLYDSGGFTKAEGLVFRILLQVPAYVALLFAWQLFQNHKKLLLNRRQQILVVITLISSFVLNLIANFPAAIARYWLGTIAASLLFIKMRNSRYAALLLSSFWIFSIIVVYPATFGTRYSTSLGSILSSIGFANPVEHLYFGDYDAFQQLLNVIVYVIDNGFSFGLNFLGALLFWVPRSIWIDKPFGTGMQVSSSFGYSFTNVSSPLWAEAYYALGIAGVVFIFLIYGYFSAVVDNSSTRKYPNSNILDLFTPYWMAYQIFFLRGDILNAFAYSIPVVALLWVLSLGANKPLK